MMRRTLMISVFAAASFNVASGQSSEYPDCDSTYEVLIGNGYCTASNNNEDCGWDGGDCCACDCVDGDFTCGVYGYNCLDPDSDCYHPDYPECESQNAAFIGNGNCWASLNNENCGWDGGDCCECDCVGSSVPCGSSGYNCQDPDSACHKEDYPDCFTIYANNIGSGLCTPENNNEECDWDGGDCCECDCVDNSFVCGGSGYDCLDPDSACSAASSTTPATSAPLLPTPPTSAPTTPIPPTSAPTSPIPPTSAPLHPTQAPSATLSRTPAPSATPPRTVTTPAPLPSTATPPGTLLGTPTPSATLPRTLATSAPLSSTPAPFVLLLPSPSETPSPISTLAPISPPDDFSTATAPPSPAASATAAPLAGDKDGNGLVNSADSGIRGDTNGDGVVDDADTGLVGDTNGDGIVNDADEIVAGINTDGEEDGDDGPPYIIIVGVVAGVLLLGAIVVVVLVETGRLTACKCCTPADATPSPVLGGSS